MGQVLNYDEKTVALLTAIKGDATSLYKERVPDATDENMARVGDAILKYEQTRNEFLQALVDRIALTLIQSADFKNPLSMFKKGTKKLGKDIQDVFVDLIKANAFDPKNSYANVEKMEKPNVLSVFYTTNRKDKYKTTVSDAQLKEAFTSSDGMANLITLIINALYISNEVDEFELMKGLFRVAGVTGTLPSIVIPDPQDEATTKEAMRKIKKASNDMMFPALSKAYNYADVVNPISKDQQVVIIDTDFDAVVDVELLASAFNMEKADFEQQRIIVDDFGGLTGVKAIVCSYQWLMSWQDLMETRRRENEDGLYTNIWLHVWQTMATSPYECAVAFVVDAPTITALDIIPATATVEAGKSVQFNIQATGTNNPTTKATWTHNGTSQYTSISSLGFLVVGEDETTNPITVTATSDINDLVSDTATVTIV